MYTNKYSKEITLKKFKLTKWMIFLCLSITALKASEETPIKTSEHFATILSALKECVQKKEASPMPALDADIQEANKYFRQIEEAFEPSDRAPRPEADLGVVFTEARCFVEAGRHPV